ncbi:MAG: metal ABC transporter ATP-binding protein [bacterium]
MNRDEEIVRLKGIWARYNGLTILENINLSIKQRDFLGLIGPNGGGKTTLLKIILGLIKPARGEVRVFGHSPDRSGKLIGYVPQVAGFDRQFPVSVWEVVLMGRLGHRRIFSSYQAEDREIAREALQTMEMLDFKDRQIGKLSGGQQQRVLIARALAGRPKLLLLDEPTAGVDTRMQIGLYELLKRFKEDMAIILVSHDLAVISSYVDKIACLNRRLFYHDSTEITLQDLEKVYDQCPIEMIAHGIPHRVMREHPEK